MKKTTKSTRTSKATKSSQSGKKSTQSKTTRSKSSSSRSSNAAMNTLSVIPTVKAGAQSLVGVVKSSGKISGYKLSSGKIVNKSQAVALAKKGQIKGVGVGKRLGSEYLRSIPTGGNTKVIGNLPTVSQ